ncbi:MAG: hypothetical protein JNG88_16525 [Phycisphaerales bacterium]|nr:hypothetical protein [Phycisphaerales bacterium]
MISRSYCASLLVLLLAAPLALAQQSLLDYPPKTPGTQPRDSHGSPALAFAGGPTFSLTQDTPTTQKAPPKEPRGKDASPEHGESPFHYREISDFFNIREAYSNVTQGEWEFETTFEWETKSGSSDSYGPVFSLKYGITDTFHAELEVEQITLGQGGDQGNGELALILFKEWWKEAEILPAFATWGEMRIPSGQGSSGVDGELHFNVTKTLLPNFRGHFEGFIETANGARGGEDEDLRRAFQWGVGPGFDYSFSDDTIAAVNYLMRSSEEYGHHNQNILQLGLAQRIAQNQHLKFAVDVGLDGADETPNLGAKILWSIEW